NNITRPKRANPQPRVIYRLSECARESTGISRGTTRPQPYASTISRAPGTSETTTGRPHARYSTTFSAETPDLAFRSDENGAAHTLEAEMQDGTFSWGIVPTNRTRFPSASSSVRCKSTRLLGPSPTIMRWT